MSLLLTGYSTRGYSALSRMSFYNFCSRSGYAERGFGSSPLIAKLTTKDNITDILKVYSQNKDKYSTEHYALTCRSIGRHLSFEKKMPIQERDPIIQDFVSNLEEQIDIMNPSELIDILFMLRKQKTVDSNLIYLKDNRKLLEKITSNIESDIYNVRNLISLIYSMAVMGYNSSQAINVLLSKLKSPEGDVIKDITVFSASQLIIGLSLNRLTLSSPEKRLLNEILNILDRHDSHESMDNHAASNLLKAISRIHVDDSPMYPFVRKIVRQIEQNFESLSEGEIISLLRVGENTHNGLFLKPAFLIKQAMFDSIEMGNFFFGIEFLFRAMSIMSRWVDPPRFTGEEQEQIIRFLENNAQILKSLSFTRYPPRYLKLFNRENANTLANLVLSNVKETNINLVSGFSRATNVISKVPEDQLLNEDQNLFDLLKLEQIFLNTKSLPPQLGDRAKKNIDLIKKAMSNRFAWSLLRNFLKESSRESQYRVIFALKEHILEMSHEEIAKQLKKPDFIFALMLVLGKDRDRVRTLLREVDASSKVSIRSMKAVTTFVEDSNTHLFEDFWALARAINFDPRDVNKVVSPAFFIKSSKNMRSSHPLLEYLMQRMRTSEVIDFNLLLLLNLTIENSSSIVGNRQLLGIFFENINKNIKVDKSNISRLLQNCKREGFLTRYDTKKLVEKYQFLQEEENFYSSSFSEDVEEHKRNIDKINKITSFNLEVLLMFNSELWKHLKGEVQSYVEREYTMSFNRWNNILSSLRAKNRHSEDYREIANALISNFFKQIENKHLNPDTVKAIEHIYNYSPDKITPELIEKIAHRGITTHDQSLNENIAYLLNKFNYNDMFGYVKKMENVKGRLPFIWKYNITVPEEEQSFLENIINNPRQHKQSSDFLATLVLNDHLPQANEYLKQNMESILTSRAPVVLKSYLQSNYGSGFDVASYNFKNHNKFKLDEKIKQIVGSTGLAFEENPVVQGVRFNYKIGDKLVMVSNSFNYFSVPTVRSRNTKERTNSSTAIMQRMLSNEVKLPIIWVPNNFNSIFILEREIPEFKSERIREGLNKISEELDPEIDSQDPPVTEEIESQYVSEEEPATDSKPNSN